MQTEVDDLALLLETTGARNVFALSSGALIALQTALSSDGISRLALYEPPLAIDGMPSPGGWIPRY
jgi:pimeloyl-ACP methyl ester carboxylesterase